jgi:hypothetical protein
MKRIFNGQLGFWLFFLSGFFFTVSCGTTSNTYPYSFSGGSATASYSSLQAYLFTPYCSSCHQQFGSYQGVVSDLNNVYTHVVVRQDMPQGGVLPPALIQALASWVQAGAPNN